MKSQRDVRIVAILFILSGVLTLIGGIQKHRIELIGGILGIPIGVGLIRFRSGWRTLALIWLWIGLITISVFGTIAIFSGSFSIGLFGFRSRSPVFGALVVSLAFLFEFWQYRVLTRPEVRRWFDLGEPSVA